jgi:hypothetical protein
MRRETPIRFGDELPSETLLAPSRFVAGHHNEVTPTPPQKLDFYHQTAKR